MKTPVPVCTYRPLGEHKRKSESSWSYKKLDVIARQGRWRTGGDGRSSPRASCEPTAFALVHN
jgi:hypothetical protein